MTRKVLLFSQVCILTALLAACSAVSTNATGDWEEDSSAVNEGAYTTMSLSQSGNIISGNVFAGAVGANVRGEASGNRFTLVSIEAREPDSTLVVDGQINGNTMTGSASYTFFGAAQQVPFSLQRVE